MKENASKGVMKHLNMFFLAIGIVCLFYYSLFKHYKIILIFLKKHLLNDGNLF